MVIPEQVKIGGHIYAVKRVSPSPLAADPEDSALGAIEHEGPAIHLDGSAATSIQEVTFFHEVMHAMNAELEHDLLESLSQQIYGFLVDNDLLK